MNIQRKNLMSWKTLRFLLAVLSLNALMMVTGTCRSYGQFPSPLDLSQREETLPRGEEIEKPSVAERRENVKQRLKEAEAQLKAYQEDEEGPAPPASLKREIEQLSRIETVLAQLAAEKKTQEKNEQDRESLQKATDDFLEHGFGETERISFLELDQAQDDLVDEQRRLARLQEEEKSSMSALEDSEQDLRQKTSTRRLAQEKYNDNARDELRQKLGDALARAKLLSELATETTALRKQEATNAAQEVRLQKLRTGLLKEKVGRMKTRALFGSPELQEIIEAIDQQEEDLEDDIAKLEAQQKYLEDPWTRAQLQFKESTGNQEAIREELAADQLNKRIIEEGLPLLQKQVERLSKDREVWKRRHSAFNGRTNRHEIRAWIDESQEAMSQLQREERKSNFEIEEIKNQILPLKEKEDDLPEESTEVYWVSQQIKHLRALSESHDRNLLSIKASQGLHQKLLGELEADSLATTAVDRLSDLWGLVDKIWNYELTAFDERSVTVQKVVTALIVLVVGMYISRLLSRTLRRQVLRRLDFDPSAAATIQSLFYYLLLLIFGLFALNVAKVPLTAFTVLGGAVALGIGFGSQNIINNFISGLVMMAERPVKVGDLIQIGHLYGNVENIGARSTRIRTGANLEIIVPNSSFLQDNVINFTLSSNKVRTYVEVGVVYGSPTVTVTQLLRRAAVETGRVAKDPPPIILFRSFGDSALVFEVHFWIHMRTMMDQLQIESAVRFRIDQLFREEGIVIAFPQSDVHLDTSSPLKIQMLPEPSKPSTN